jgi:cytoskeleton protein RodZ
MKLTGELLKNERLNKNLSVQDVAQALKLSSKIVNSIEAGDTASLPAKTFVRGFVKSYAQLLKLDTDSVLRQFQEEMGSTTPLPKTPPPTQSSSRAESFKTSKPTPKQTAQNYTAGQPKMHGAEIEKDYSKHTKTLLSAWEPIT